MGNAFVAATVEADTMDVNELRDRLFKLKEATVQEREDIIALIKKRHGENLSHVKTTIEMVESVLDDIDEARREILSTIESKDLDMSFDQALEALIKAFNAYTDEGEDGEKMSPKAEVAKLREELAYANAKNLKLRGALLVESGVDKAKVVSRAIKDKLITKEESEVETVLETIISRAPKGFFSKADLLDEDDELAKAKARIVELETKEKTSKERIERLLSEAAKETRLDIPPKILTPPKELPKPIANAQSAHQALYFLETAEERIAGEKLSKQDRINLKGDIRAALLSLREALEVDKKEE
jgi:hypothetical protein